MLRRGGGGRGPALAQRSVSVASPLYSFPVAANFLRGRNMLATQVHAGVSTAGPNGSARGRLRAHVPSPGDSLLSGGRSPDPELAPSLSASALRATQRRATRSSLCMTHRVPRDPQVTSQPGSWTAESLAALPVASSPTSSTLASGKPHWHPIFSRLGRGDVWPAEHGDCPPGPTRAAPACPFRPPASLRPDPSARAPDAADRRCTAEAGAAAPCTPVLQPRPVPDSGESSKLLAR